MEQLRKLIASLTLGQRIMLLAAAILVVSGTLGFVHWRKESDFRPLFTNLAPEDAGAVVQKLRESGSEYRLDQGGTTVMAPSSRIAELRLDLASAGLPKSGRIGFELFDKTNFGATEFTEKINYRRALEGELERSIMTLSEVESARVHVTFPRDSVFLESQQPGKASIILRLRPGAHLSKQNVVAVTNLAASAVEGLAPESVSVIDGQGNLLSRPRAQNASADTQPPDANLDYKQKIEADLLAKVNATLDPLLGPDKFRSGITVDCDFTRAEQSEEMLDPTKSVMMTSMKTDEDTASQPSGVPGTASNLPRPTARPTGSSNGVSHHTENITYQTSRTVRHTVLPQGVIKKISVSILVDQNVRWQGVGAKARRILDPPSADKLKAIQDLIAGVVGVTPERGDQVLVETLPFEATLNTEPPAAPAPPPTPPGKYPQWLTPYLQNPKMLMIPGGVVLGVLVVFAVLMVMIFRRKKKTAPATAETSPAVAGHAEPAALPSPGVAAGAIKQQMQDKLAAQEALQAQA
ncbi:MAG TPA: flagellar basal-body MS-ring/collar protein FliF, partial [Bryobacteraceae bacterium]